jgi:hypothetical protein
LLGAHPAAQAKTTVVTQAMCLNIAALLKAILPMARQN